MTKSVNGKKVNSSGILASGPSVLRREGEPNFKVASKIAGYSFLLWVSCVHDSVGKNLFFSFIVAFDTRASFFRAPDRTVSSPGSVLEPCMFTLLITTVDPWCHVRAGLIPESLGDLSELRELSLSKNGLTGEIGSTGSFPGAERIPVSC